MERRGAGASHSLRKALGHRAVAKRYVESLIPPAPAQPVAQEEEEQQQPSQHHRKTSLGHDTTLAEQATSLLSAGGSNLSIGRPDLRRYDSTESTSSDNWVDENVVPVGEESTPLTVAVGSSTESVVMVEDVTLATTTGQTAGAREALSTLYEVDKDRLLKEAVEGSSSVEEGQEGDGHKFEGDDKTETDIIEEMLALDENALLADKILAHYYLGDKPGLKRYDSADAAMERERQKRPQAPSSGIIVEKLRGVSPDSQPSAIFASTEDPSLPPRYAPECSTEHNFHEISLESPGATSPIHTHHTFAINNNAWGPPPAFLAGAPKLERFDSADYYMQVYGRGGDNNLPKTPITATTNNTANMSSVPAREMDISPIPGQPFVRANNFLLDGTPLQYPLPTFQRFDSADYYLSQEKEKTRQRRATPGGGAQPSEVEEEEQDSGDKEEEEEEEASSSSSTLGFHPPGGDGFRASANFLIDPGAFRSRFS